MPMPSYTVVYRHNSIRFLIAINFLNFDIRNIISLKMPVSEKIPYLSQIIILCKADYIYKDDFHAIIRGIMNLEKK
jgi:hypothetical protein